MTESDIPVTETEIVADIDNWRMFLLGIEIDFELNEAENKNRPSIW